MSKTLEVLKKCQKNIASCKEKCDEDELIYWNKIDEAIAELEAMKEQISQLKNEVSFLKDDVDKERLGIIIDCLKLDCDKKDEDIALLKQCVEEAIKRPMGVEPSIYSNYKMSKEIG